MSYREEDFANMLFHQLGVEGHIAHLNELDPTHVAAQPTSLSASNASQATQGWHAPLPSCVLTDFATAPVLLELDPTHLLVR